jgi:hypothetical protein
VANKENFEVWSGEDRTLTLHARDSNNAVVNLTGYTVKWLVGIPPNRPYLQWSVISKTGTVTDPTNGIFTVSLLASDTQDITGNYLHEALASINNTTAVVSTGRLKIRRTIQQ